MIGKILLGAALLLALPAGAQPAPKAQVSVTVDTSRPGPAIDRHIYGQFAEHLGTGIYGGIWVGADSKIPNIRGYRKDVVAALQHIHVPVIRWPGGCFADLYNWRDGIGPRDKRPVRINVHWGGVTDDNAFGTHEFMDFAELVGADPYVSINVGSLTPYDAAQWVEYMTSDEKATLANERRANGRDKPWNLKYLGIGNETWGCGGNMTPEYAASINARYSSFVNAPASMGMIKVASGATGNVGGKGDPVAFTEAMMKDGGRLQALSFHYYAMPMGRDRGPATGFGEDLWARELDLAREMEPLVSKVSATMDKYDPDKKVGLYVDEWGAWYDQEPGSHPGFLYQQNSLRDAVVAALTLDIFHRHTDRVRLAAIAQMVNVLQAMILTDGPKMLLTPTYHVFDMYQPFMGAVPYPATVSGPDYSFAGHSMAMVDVSAARGKDGKLYLALVNTDPHRSAHVVTNLTGTARGRILTGAAMDAHNTFDAPDAIHPAAFSGTKDGGKLAVDLPAKSVAVIAVE
ncbi:MAG TPA: alpha-L-arabinofuranosidase C-terminal domain-containing protein [Rhizomicrobium sp.]|nr:alpha-L-arabinofuranosidase C-terminal domain-containing protein [Rhizomicrobium sp.]